MTTRDTPWPAGTPCWVGTMVSDVASAQTFYRSLLGWSYDESSDEFAGYTTSRLNGRAVAGMMPVQPDMGDAPIAWTTYLATEDIAATVRAVTEAGGQIYGDTMQVADLGTMAVGADPTGAMFGLWQAGTHTGVEVANEPGALTWNECVTRDFEGAKRFYGTVFGYEFDDMSDGGFHYATIKVGGEVVGGIGGLPDDAPAQWVTYFAVADTDKVVATVIEQGGKVQGEPFDSPYGRIAVVVDNQGALFRVIASEPA